MRRQLQALRERMTEYNIDAYLVPTDDFHGSEYVGAHFACREYISGFTGSAGTLLVFPSWAGLWTDGRYFLQAEEQLKDSGITLMKSGLPGVPSLEQFLRNSMQAEQTLGFDGRCVSARQGRTLHTLMRRIGARVKDRLDLVGEIWSDRPPLSSNPAWLLSEEYSGQSRAEKLMRVRKSMASAGAGVFLLTSLEDIGWLLNLRGSDIPCTPVVLSYLAVTETDCVLFANTAAFSDDILDELANDGVVVRPYDTFYSYVGRLQEGRRVLLDSRRINTCLLSSIPSKVSLIDRPNPTEAMKAAKNSVEVENIRKAHLSDGIALTRFMYYIKKKAAAEKATEISAAEVLETLRREQKDYLGPSFDPIIAYGPHSAVIHYSATKESSCVIGNEGFLLCDTGGHYLTGTTDCTRTYAMGTLSPDQKECYTAVLRGNLNLANAVFRSGCTGVNLDILARRPLWEIGLDYNHGTGHGVGYLLNVHEGPQNISTRSVMGRDAAFETGMITSDEPGVYFDGHYGIRLENLIACVEKYSSPLGSFLGFDTLTLTPFDLDAVDPSLMTEQEKELLNTYHTRVREAISPFLSEEESLWLSEVTRSI